MKIVLKFLKWFGITLTCLFIVAIVFLHTLDFSASEEDINQAFQQTDYPIEEYQLQSSTLDVHYVAIGDTSKPKVIFVHGSPGSWDNFLGFMRDNELLESFRLIALDRPGFGKSQSGKPARSLQKQAEAVAMVVENESDSTENILVGHSYGGPVIAKFAIEYPSQTDGLIFVAASVDPELEKTKWFQIPVHYKALSWVLPDMLYSSNEEILALKEELEIMDSEWTKINSPISIIQGTKDRLVPPENADYLKSKLTHTDQNVVIRDINHFVPWEHPELIRTEIQSFIK